MKKNRIYSLASMCALFCVAVSCNNEAEVTPIEVGTVTINVNSTLASIGDNNTRATLDNDDKTPNWEANDVISVKVDEGEPMNLTLASGAGTAKGAFSGTIPSSGINMKFYYPSTASTYVDLTNQDGSNTKEMVMFASTPYSTTPNITFQNKTSILKLNMKVPEGITFVENTELFVKVTGAFSKGVLDSDGVWSSYSSNVINVTNAKIIDDDGTKRVSAYVVVIPSSEVKNLRIHVGGKVNETEYKNFVTDYYTSENTIAVNNVVSINKSCATLPANFKTTYAIDDYYQWDAYSHYVNGNTDWWGEGSETYNGSDLNMDGSAINDWTRHCLTLEQITIMLGNQPYWDTKGGIKYQYTCTNGNTSSNGIWLKKLVYCDITHAIYKTEDIDAINTAYLADEVSEDIRSCGKFFFLPASGFYYSNLQGSCMYGSYWSATVNELYMSFALTFEAGFAMAESTPRFFGSLPLVCE